MNTTRSSIGRPRKQLTLTQPLPLALEHHWPVARIAAAHELTAKAVIHAIERGDLKARKFGKEWRVPDAAYRDWLRRSEVFPEHTDDEGKGRAA